MTGITMKAPAAGATYANDASGHSYVADANGLIYNVGSGDIAALEKNGCLPFTAQADLSVTASSVALTQGGHANKTVQLNNAAGIAVALPAATGTGDVYSMEVGTTVTSNNTIITPAGSDKIQGFAVQTGAAGATTSFAAAGAGTLTTLNGSTKGGIKGDIITYKDVAAGQWQVLINSNITGTAVTPFS